MFFVKAQIHLYAWYFIIYFHSRYPTDENNIFEAIKYFCVTKVRCGHMSSQFAPGCEDQWQQSQQIRSQHHNSWPHHSPGVSWHCVTPPRDNQPRDSEQSSKKCWWSPQINWLERGVTTSDCIPWARRGEGCPVRVREQARVLAPWRGWRLSWWPPSSWSPQLPPGPAGAISNHIKMLVM